MVSIRGDRPLPTALPLGCHHLFTGCDDILKLPEVVAWVWGGVVVPSSYLVPLSSIKLLLQPNSVFLYGVSEWNPHKVYRVVLDWEGRPVPPREKPWAEYQFPVSALVNAHGN